MLRNENHPETLWRRLHKTTNGLVLQFITTVEHRILRDDGNGCATADTGTPSHPRKCLVVQQEHRDIHIGQGGWVQAFPLSVCLCTGLA